MNSTFSDIRPVDLTPLKVFQLYCSIKLHFSSKKYDYIKYGINERSFNEKSFEKRSDKYFFEKISEKVLYQSRLNPILISNLYATPKMWVGELLDKQALTKAMAYRQYMNGFENSFISDIKKLILDGVISHPSQLYSENTKTNYFSILSKNLIHPITGSVLNNLFYAKYISKSAMSFVYDDKSFYLNRLHQFIPEDKARVVNEDTLNNILDL